ncbi:protein amnionless [Numida meleagris]|uniref:protein amnionless n=1 Tax=Numida meleagris TaxID=8996 RepID=UPI000B3E21D2|nr:protein amnionless [Numida meleagris]
MGSLAFLLGVLQLLAAAMAAYKKWIPNTNFETASNWDKERVPCASDMIRFEKEQVVSVFVRSTHALTDMYLPLNGEFLLASGAGFAAFNGSWDPGCGSGAVLSFASAEQHSWFNPELWQDVSSSTDMEPAGRIFLLDEERVPCQYDNVIFQPETSFRVNLDSSRQVIPVRSISLMGQELSSSEAWAEYLRGPSATWQFHGNATLQVTGARCPHSSGCACGNSQDGDRICASLLGAEGCPALACHSPLQPLGHCCGVCGAVVTLDFKPEFDLQQYRDRVVQAWLSLPKYAGVQMAISKVHRAQTFLGLLSRGSTPVIQIVLVDGEAGAQTGTAAGQLAADIMDDIAQHGEALGIPGGSVEVATGSALGGQAAGRASRQIASGMVLGLLFTLLVFGGLLYLHRKGKLRLRVLRLPWPWDRAEDLDSPKPESGKGFDNPMFDVELPGAGSVEETLQEVAPEGHQVFYLNPLYSPSETET